MSTRFRSRAVRDDHRAAVQVREDEIRQLTQEAERLAREAGVQAEDLQYLGKLEGFTATTLKGQVERGTLDDGAVIKLSDFLMERRATKARAEGELRQRWQATNARLEDARKQLAGLTGGADRVERDAVVVIGKARPEGGTVRLGYLVGAATWRPQYRLRVGADAAPVRLEYLAAVTQQTGEDWSGAKITLSTARPTLDAAPPDLLPLRMAGDAGGSPSDGQSEQSDRIRAALAEVVDMPFQVATPLDDVVRYVRQNTSGPAFPQGIPIYVDPRGLQDADKTTASTISLDLRGLPLRTTLRLALDQLNLTYRISDGLLTITSPAPEDGRDAAGPSRFGLAGMGGGMGGMGGGMGGMEFSLEQAEAASAAGAAQLNRAAAAGQAEELRVGGGPDAPPSGAGSATPGVSFALAGPIEIASRPDPQLLEVGQAELPAELYAQAVPVLTPRVYRLARLTNASDLVLLPGAATVYVGDEFVGRMQLPLVAAGEAFVAGLGVAPLLQVSRRLVARNRAVQGANQVFTYEFRLNLRNYRNAPVKVQLWDRFPVAQGEAVPVTLTRTSLPLSTDTTYEKTARADNLLRWDVDLPARTVGDQPLSLTYEFRLESARNLPPPRFLSGGLNEAPIGGPAAAGMGGMGGFRSVRPGGE